MSGGVRMFAQWDRAVANAVARASSTGLRYQVGRGPNWVGHVRWEVRPLAEAIGLPHQDVIESLRTDFKPPAPVSVQQRLRELGVTSVEVKRWAVAAGLRDAVTRGRVASDLVEAYAKARVSA